MIEAIEIVRTKTIGIGTDASIAGTIHGLVCSSVRVFYRSLTTIWFISEEIHTLMHAGKLIFEEKRKVSFGDIGVNHSNRIWLSIG